METLSNPRIGNVEAGAAWLVLAAYMALPALFSGIRDWPLSVTVPLAMGLSGLGILLSTWGIRFGRGYGKTASWICLTIWIYLTVIYIIIGLNHGGAGW